MFPKDWYANLLGNALPETDTVDVMTKTNTRVILVANASETELTRQRRKD